MQRLQVEGNDVDWVRDADPYRAWLRLINLHYTARQSVTVRSRTWYRCLANN